MTRPKSPICGARPVAVAGEFDERRSDVHVPHSRRRQPKTFGPRGDRIGLFGSDRKVAT